MKKILLLLIAVISSCTTSNQDDNNSVAQEQKLELVATDIVKHYPLDELSMYQTNYYQTKNINDTIYLFWANKEIPYISVYNLNSEKKITDIKFDSDGNNGIGGWGGFYLHNWDSIFVFGAKSFQVTLANQKGEVLGRCRLYDTGKESPFMLPLPRSNAHQSFLIGDTLYFRANDNSTYRVDEPSFFNANFLYAIDIRTMKGLGFIKIGDSEIDGNENIWGAYFTHLQYTLSFDSSQLLISYPIENNIHIRHFNKKENIKKIMCNSFYFENIKSKWSESKYFNHHEKHYLENPSFRYLLADKYNRVYYRFAYQAIEETNAEGKKQNWDDKPCSIIILDEEYNIVGETLLPKKIYSRNHFITQEGLWLSEGHYRNPDLDEDNLSFRLFKLQRKK
ncbi:DUF4221 family protein [Hugenholtzia roseola]|uniref:DUF4221 family protein n=1 Tax=Hugenholtzia roseola TaxID=1002 RepID=UPI00041D2755|nr:DUF4221 family protein [Hugenholtzia roseola]